MRLIIELLVIIYYLFIFSGKIKNMESILKSDIFFFIASISVTIVTIVFLVAGFYFIRMIRNFYKISETLRMYTKDTENELKEMGSHIRQSPLFTFIFGKEKVKRESERSSKKVI